MIHLIVGDYELKPNDHVVREITSGSLSRNFSTVGKNLVLFTDELNLKKKDVDQLIETGYDLTVIVHDRKIVKGKRKSGTKQYTLQLNEEDATTDANPFELIKIVFGIKDRKDLFEYLKESKNSLYVLMMIMCCNTDKMCQQNREVVEWLSKNYYRVKYEIVCAKIAYAIKPEKIWRFDWLYKKDKKEDEE